MDQRKNQRQLSTEDGQGDDLWELINELNNVTIFLQSLLT